MVSVTSMRKTIIVLCLCLPCICSAQADKFDFGLSTTVFFRPSETYINTYNHLFGAIGLDGVLRVNGTEETDMSFVLNTGITDDIRKFDISVSAQVKTSLYFVNINPSVVIPSKWPHIQFCLGIGTLVRLGQDVVFSWDNSPSGGNYITVDSMNKLINANTRSVMPYMSFGISKDIRKHFRLEFTLRPTLINLYEPGTTINFSYNSGNTFGSTILELNYQPIYVGFRFFYFFKGAQ